MKPLPSVQINNPRPREGPTKAGSGLYFVFLKRLELVYRLLPVNKFLYNPLNYNQNYLCLLTNCHTYFSLKTLKNGFLRFARRMSKTETKSCAPISMI